MSSPPQLGSICKSASSPSGTVATAALTAAAAVASLLETAGGDNQAENTTTVKTSGSAREYVQNELDVPHDTGFESKQESDTEQTAAEGPRLSAEKETHAGSARRSTVKRERMNEATSTQCVFETISGKQVPVKLNAPIADRFNLYAQGAKSKETQPVAKWPCELQMLDPP